MIEDNGMILADSGAILECLKATYDAENLLHLEILGERLACRFWLHYAKGSLMPMLLMKQVFSHLGKPPVPCLLRPIGKALSQGIQKCLAQ